MHLDRQPTLAGATLRVRPLVESDREALFSVASDPLIWEQHPSRRYERAEFDSFFDDSLRSGGAVLIEDLEGHAIGSSRFQLLDEPASVAIGWTFLARTHWGGATNGEVKDLMLDHAFTAVDRVRFHIAPDNVRSQRAVEKLGASRMAETLPNGNAVYELMRADWHH